MTAATLANAVDVISNQTVSSEFIPTSGMTKDSIKYTLQKWLKQDTVVVLTLNLQSLDDDMTPPDQLADAWHHHPVSHFVDDETVSMMYPQVEYSVDELHRMLECESCLLIRPADIVFQTSPKGVDGILVPRRTEDIKLLGLQKDPRWGEFKVTGGIHEILQWYGKDREMDSGVSPTVGSSRVKIPAVYEPGITVFQRQEKQQN